MINIVLHEPEIPQNTGNIARTCAVTGSSLHLIHPLGFSLSQKHLRRAGLDYWDSLDLQEYDSLTDFFNSVDKRLVFAATTKGRSCYSDCTFPEEVYFLFGKESAGLPEELIKELGEHSIRIPMGADHRSLNLSNCAAILTYEALRQRGFAHLEQKGDLHRLDWET